jgi:hypothetical protein
MNSINISNIKWIVIICLLIYIFLLQECSNNENKINVKSTVDTLYIKGKNDTILFEIVKPIYINVNIPTPVYIYDTIMNDSLNLYNSIIEDSLISGEIKSRVKGNILSQEFNYKPKFPKFILRTDTILVSKETIEIHKKSYIGLGLELGGNQSLINVSPKISYTSKSNYIYSYRYGLIDKTHNISIVKTFNLKELR